VSLLLFGCRGISARRRSVLAATTAPRTLPLGCANWSHHNNALKFVDLY
jgi:hypothetical protein